MTLAMSWDEWAAQDATALAEKVRRGELKAAELAQQAAAGIAKTNPALSAVVEVFEDVVADPLKDGLNPQGPFAGVPFLMKDLGPTLKGRLQEQGSLFMRGNRPTEDAWLTRQMRKAGLNLMGRTTTPEFGVCSSAENPAVYVTRNPWNTEFTTCGSSAGTSAMVAMVRSGLGSTLASVLRPAANRTAPMTIQTTATISAAHPVSMTLASPHHNAKDRNSRTM